ncbi:Uncharacterised protein [Mycobacteroides abscessus subsp. abscessus]|nr:Uncharacterised protein [Mycobacteroides abscessus subsp. abscessus]
MRAGARQHLLGHRGNTLGLVVGAVAQRNRHTQRIKRLAAVQFSAEKLLGEQMRVRVDEAAKIALGIRATHDWACHIDLGFGKRSTSSCRGEAHFSRSATSCDGGCQREVATAACHIPLGARTDGGRECRRSGSRGEETSVPAGEEIAAEARGLGGERPRLPAHILAASIGDLNAGVRQSVDVARDRSRRCREKDCDDADGEAAREEHGGRCDANPVASAMRRRSGHSRHGNRGRLYAQTFRYP